MWNTTSTGSVAMLAEPGCRCKTKATAIVSRPLPRSQSSPEIRSTVVALARRLYKARDSAVGQLHRARTFGVAKFAPPSGRWGAIQGKRRVSADLCIYSGLLTITPLFRTHLQSRWLARILTGSSTRLRWVPTALVLLAHPRRTMDSECGLT